MQKKIALIMPAIAGLLLSMNDRTDPGLIVINHGRPSGPEEEDKTESKSAQASAIHVPSSFKEDDTIRTFIVKGQPIQARSLKMAKKIYSHTSKVSNNG
ncbi:hypothetical protein F0L74_09895 [Chitinophaga agrisoli]|uniref:Uncharacterized protein n=1 Tax=Chitinophaga agrisoli TaxID=2607653 RepID=A0A5B2VUC5_9BACT|nr:hypothetical protein [Chitinophaga agrisoli]KAA2242831.1 hypothetical protein F0L74_09895 [Chitinophaga agrisoli]